MRRWVAALLVVAVLALGYTAVEGARARNGGDAEAREFHRMVGGLGMGATSALYWDYATFDPRLEPDCTCSLWPVPGGFLFSPEHRSTAWDPPESWPASRAR